MISWLAFSVKKQCFCFVFCTVCVSCFAHVHFMLSLFCSMLHTCILCCTLVLEIRCFVSLYTVSPAYSRTDDKAYVTWRFLVISTLLPPAGQKLICGGICFSSTMTPCVFLKHLVQELPYQDMFVKHAVCKSKNEYFLKYLNWFKLLLLIWNNNGICSLLFMNSAFQFIR